MLILLTEEQIVTVEKAKQQKEALEEIETEHLGSHDTYYISSMKEVRKIYQQTFVDTYSICRFT